MSNPVLDRLHLGTPSAGPPSAIQWFDVRQDFGAVGNGVTDDSGALDLANAALIAQGGGTLFFPGPSTYRTTRRLNLTTSHVVIEGNGSTILFDPSNAVTHDRWLAITGTVSGFRPITGALAAGFTSFTATNLADVSDLVVNDWLTLTEKDTPLGDVYCVDWVQVASVVGAVVTLRAPCHTAFPGTHNTVQFRRVSSLTHDVTVRDLTGRMTTTPATTVTGLTVGLGARGVLIDHVDFSEILNGSGMTTYLPSDVIVRDSRFGARGMTPEFAATVDLRVTGCTFGSFDAAPTNSAASIDFGTTRFTFAHNMLLNAGNIGLQIVRGVHDGEVCGNVIGWVKDVGIGTGNGIVGIGCNGVHVHDNVLVGGDTGSGNTGVSFATDTTAAPNVNSVANVIGPNVIRNFSTPIPAPPKTSATDIYLYPNATTGLFNVPYGLAVGDGDTTTPSLANISQTGTGLSFPFANYVAILNNSVNNFLFGPLGQAYLSSIGAINQTTGATSGTVDLRLRRSAAKTWTVDDGAGGAAAWVVQGAFGCNTKSAQTAAASGGALNAYGAGINGFDTAGNASALYAMVVAIRAALVANGIMS